MGSTYRLWFTADKNGVIDEVVFKSGKPPKKSGFIECTQPDCFSGLVQEGGRFFYYDRQTKRIVRKPVVEIRATPNIAQSGPGLEAEPVTVVVEGIDRSVALLVNDEYRVELEPDEQLEIMWENPALVVIRLDELFLRADDQHVRFI